MNIGAALQSMVHQQIRRFGDGLQITLRERSTLRNTVTGAPTNALTLFANALAGATEIVAESANLIGYIPAGAKITLGAVEYTLDAAARADATTTQLTLELASALTGNVAAGISVTVSQPYAETTYTAMRARTDQREATDGMPDTARVYRLSARTLAGAAQTRAPRKGDVMTDTAGGATETVTEVREAPPGSTDIYWTIVVGSAK